MEASTTPKSCMDFLLVLLKKSDDISEHGPWFTAQKVCKGQLECSIQCAIYICHRSSYSDSEPRMLPHSRFSVVIMVNPRKWSTLDGAVDYGPVLSAPCREIPLKIPGRYPRLGLYVHCYCSIAIVIPDTLRRSAASTALSKNDLGSINRLSFRTVLESKGQYVSHLCKISGSK